MPRDTKNEKMYFLTIPVFIKAGNLNLNFNSSSLKQHAENPHSIRETNENNCGTVNSKTYIGKLFEKISAEKAVPTINPSDAPRYIIIPLKASAGNAKKANVNMRRRHFMSKDISLMKIERKSNTLLHFTSYET